MKTNRRIGTRRSSRVNQPTAFHTDRIITGTVVDETGRLGQSAGEGQDKATRPRLTTREQ